LGDDSGSPPAADAELAALARRRWRIAAVLSAAMFVAYFGFILVVAFAKPVAGGLIGGSNVSLGIVLGAGAIVVAPVLTTIYVRWANRHYDAAVKRLREGKRP
jgi:uncharacterized membrane protein (DUF485 family)